MDELTCKEFNKKWVAYLEDDHYGLYINDIYVIAYLDNIFGELTQIPGFKYRQIKTKFDTVRFYTNLYDIGFKILARHIEGNIERKIEDILKLA